MNSSSFVMGSVVFILSGVMGFMTVTTVQMN